MANVGSSTLSRPRHLGAPALVIRMAGGSLMSAASRRIRVRGLALVEQQKERAGIGSEITPEQPARLEPDSPGPFQADVLHPLRRARPASRQEVEQSARGLDDADIAQARREFLDKGLFIGNAECNP